MFEKDFTLIFLSKKRILYKRIIFFSFLIVALYIFLFSDNFDNHKILLDILLVLILSWVIANFISGFFISSYKKKGKISFSNDNIIVNKEIFKLSEIDINDYQGEAHTGMFFGIGSAYPKEGINNHIEILLKNGRKYKFQILFLFKRDINIIFKIFRFYYKSGINVEFYQRYKQKTLT